MQGQPPRWSGSGVILFMSNAKVIRVAYWNQELMSMLKVTVKILVQPN